MVGDLMTREPFLVGLTSGCVGGKDERETSGERPGGGALVRIFPFRVTEDAALMLFVFLFLLFMYIFGSSTLSPISGLHLGIA